MYVVFEEEKHAVESYQKIQWSVDRFSGTVWSMDNLSNRSFALFKHMYAIPSQMPSTTGYAAERLSVSAINLSGLLQASKNPAEERHVPIIAIL